MSRGPELILRFPRRVGEHSEVFQFAENGNIEGLKSLFDLGKASLSDVNERNEDALRVTTLKKPDLEADS